MEHIRLATAEEVESIAEQSEPSAGGLVLALANRAKEVNLAVVRTVVELDPVFYAKSSSDAEKARFIWGIEERMLGAGYVQYYFNVLAADEKYSKVVETWGARKVSTAPEHRYAKRLG
jgi:hypothetical protein